MPPLHAVLHQLRIAASTVSRAQYSDILLVSPTFADSWLLAPMQSPAPLAELCRRWCAAAPVSIMPMGTPGFSGSRVFAVELPGIDGWLVLKSFHAAASVEHARFVHRLVKHLRAEGLAQVPGVMPAVDGDTVVTDPAGTLWELASFMPGEVIPCPTPTQAAAAATALARLHLAAARMLGYAARMGPSPGVVRRIDQARQLRAISWQSRRTALPEAANSPQCADIVTRFDAAITIFASCGGDACLERVAAMRTGECLQQVVLRDVWCDHILFADRRSSEVTGIIDLHAAGIDTPATDLARLLGSWHAPAESQQDTLCDRWPEAMMAYSIERRLTRFEAALIPFLHASAIVFGLDNWFRWTLDERRSFADPQRVLTRIDRLIWELPAALATAGRCGDGNID